MDNKSDDDIFIEYEDEIRYDNMKYENTSELYWDLFIEDNSLPSSPQKKEQKGLISRLWLWIKGLFGGDDV